MRVLTDAIVREHPADVTALAKEIDAAIASDLATSDNVRATTREVDRATAQSIGQDLSFAVVAGRSYTITKYVAVVTSHESTAPIADARKAAEFRGEPLHRRGDQCHRLRSGQAAARGRR